MDHPKIEIPKFLAHLPLYGPYPIPFTTFIHEGKPDFRVTDMQNWDRCVAEDLCGVCGIRLGEYSYFIGGPLTLQNRMFFDPGMHELCAKFAAKICPFLSGKRMEYRPMDPNAPEPEGYQINQVDVTSDIRPEKMYILKARTKKVELVRYQGKLLIRAERFLGVRKF